MPTSNNNSVHSCKKYYDVFLSFRGEDTRESFTSHLYDALCRKNIKTYIDEDDLKRGEEISCAILKAIEESKFSIIIFSKNYASSSWCLGELLQILKCKEKNGQHVIPVFYHVNPSHVRKQRGSYKMAFDDHEQRFKDNIHKVHKWRVALTEAANLSGWNSNNIRPESKLVKTIVEDIIRKLKRLSPNNDFENQLVGIDDQLFEQIEPSIKSSLLGVCIIGLWGMGGIGKTTLARVIFSRLSHQFEGCCFLSNVREEWKNGIKEYHLQNNLFSRLLEEDVDMNNLIVGSTFYKDRLRRKKVFIVLDDVNDEEQIEYLAGSRNWYGDGSIIIITSRDKELFSNQVDVKLFEVKGLKNNDALQLFHLNVFSRSFVVPKNVELSKKVVEYAGGIPLALKVLGSYFRSKREEEWESLLAELKSSPNNDKIQNVLRRSYDELNDKQKDKFLDIACFGCHFGEDERIIADLVNKSLITINYNNKISMHDLVQKMGREIVRQESKEPGKRSRLWTTHHSCHVLKDNEATGKVEGVFLDVSDIKEVYLSPAVFQKAYNLRLLKIYCPGNVKKCKVYLPQGLQSLPDTLIYLHWDLYPLKSLPLNFSPQNLVQLIMNNSMVERLWDGVQNLWSLKVINLSYSKHLTQMPNLSQSPNLKNIDLKCCISLLEVPSDNFQNLKKLTSLDMSHCKKLEGLPENIPSTSLKRLNLRGCRKLQSIPATKENIVHLGLSDTGITKLPQTLGSFHKLWDLNLEDCKGLEDLPSNICELKSVRKINLFGCSSLREIPELPSKLVDLVLSETAIEEIPSSIGVLSCLKYFDLCDCKMLQILPTSVCKLKSLEVLNLAGCSKFDDFPEILEPMKSLWRLDLSETGIKELPSSIENLVGLERFFLRYCENLKFVPRSIYNLRELRYLNLSGNSQVLMRPPPTVGCNWLDFHVLELIEKCDNVEQIIVRDLGRLSGKNHDVMPASIKKFSNLVTLGICYWDNLQSLPELPVDLDSFDVKGFMSLETLASSRSALIQGALNQGYCSHIEAVIFANCLRLNQNACNNIIADAPLRMLRRATQVLSNKYVTLNNDRINFIFYPGNQIPEWFNYQSTGSSINIELPPDWDDSKILGFSLCFVATFEDDNFSDLNLNFSVEIELKTNKCESYKSTSFFGYIGRSTSQIQKPIINTDHVFLYYEYKSFEACKAVEGIVTEVSFHFYPYYIKSYKVKRFGIHLIYRQEADQLRISIPKINRGETIQSEQGQEHCDTPSNQIDEIIALEKFHSTNDHHDDRFGELDLVEEEYDGVSSYKSTRPCEIETFNNSDAKEDEEDELKSISSYGCLALSHVLRGIFEYCCVGKKSDSEIHLEVEHSSPTTSQVTLSPSISVQERLRAQENTIQDLQAENIKLKTILANLQPPPGPGRYPMHQPTICLGSTSQIGHVNEVGWQLA